ncbi:MAG: hypothetical protein ACK5KP_02440 [Paludibacteraceae bacterium]
MGINACKVEFLLSQVSTRAWMLSKTNYLFTLTGNVLTNVRAAGVLIKK